MESERKEVKAHERGSVVFIRTRVHGRMVFLLEIRAAGAESNRINDMKSTSANVDSRN